MKILVIDDHALIRQAMQGVLRKLKRGAVVLDAPSYAHAVQMMAEHSDINLILVCAENSNPDVLMVKATENRA
jgi:DNA-binding NarL/FixJ family response regulator